MPRRYNQNHAPFVKLVYVRVAVNGKVELKPMELYADSTVQAYVA